MKTDSLIDLAITPGLWRIAFRVSVLKGKKFPALLMGEDQILLMSLDLENAKIVFVPEVFYEYQTSVPEQLTSLSSALGDLPTTFLAANRLYKQLPKNKFRDIILTRLLFAFLKRENTPIRKKLSYLVSLFKLKFAYAAFLILKGKLFNHD
jgi:hypothetical protein